MPDNQRAPPHDMQCEAADELEDWAIPITFPCYQSTQYAAEALSRSLVHDLLSIRESSADRGVSERWPKNDLTLDVSSMAFAS